MIYCEKEVKRICKNVTGSNLIDVSIIRQTDHACESTASSEKAMNWLFTEA